MEGLKSELERAEKALLEERDDIIARLEKVQKRYSYDIQTANDVELAIQALKIFMK